MKACPRCSTEYPDDVRFCPNDGEMLRASSALGQVMGDRYRVVEKLGQGGFGESFLVDDLKLDRRAVMKVLHRTDPDSFERLGREFRLLASLDDPAFARVYEVGELDDQRPYLVTEWVQGRTLDEVRGQARLPVVDALAVGRTLARGLAHLHDAGFVHRDIKPSNVVIPEMLGRPAFDQARLLDFGAFGKLLNEGSARLTQTGFIVGTPRYMAPEQIQALPQSAATDVYGLALLVVEMLYGRLPFEGEAESGIALMVRIVQTDLEIPADPAVPEALRTLLARSLSRDPKLRPADGAALLAALEALSPAPQTPAAAAVPVRNSRPSGAAALASPRPMGRGPVAVLGAALVIAILAALTLGRPFLWIALGAAIAVGGVMLGNGVRRLARSRLHQVETDAERLLLGLRTKRALSDTIQVEVAQIIARCRELDERLLGVTILKMITEYDAATASDQRQAALMNVATLLEKLRGRLSPWYARFEKQLALATSVIGVAAGLLSVLAGVMKIVRGQP